jgi:hypothetical protein
MPDEYENEQTAASEGNGDGHQLDTNIGPTISLDQLKKGDGIFTRPTNQAQSLLRYVLNSVKDNKEYRQELKMLRFGSVDEADDFVSALTECRDLGLDETPIIDTALARSAGTGQALVSIVLEALTHTTYTVNSGKNKFNPNANKNKTGSPLS